MALTNVSTWHSGVHRLCQFLSTFHPRLQQDSGTTYLYLKTTGSSDSAPKAFRVDGNEVVGVGGRANKTVKDSSKSKKLKNEKSEIWTRFSDIEATEELMFLTLDARKIFNHLRQPFIKAPILRHFDPECHIWIKTDALGYAIGGVLSQLSTNWVTPDEPNSWAKNSTKSDFGQWYPVAYFSRKMIPAEDLIQNSQCRAPSNCWGLQNLAPLPRGLQTQISCSHWP